jgi:hypothetical protein
LKFTNIYFDICNALPIYPIFDEAKTLTAIDFSNKDKCLDFNKFNTFSNFTYIGCQISSWVTLLPILKPTMFIHSTKSIPKL